MQLEGGAEWIEASFYTPAYTLISRQKLSGPYRQGWNRASFQGDALPPGLVFYTLRCGRAEKASLASGGRAYRLP